MTCSTAVAERLRMTCSVVGCGKRRERDDNAFFPFPYIPKRCTSIRLVNTRKIRRMKWILALRRTDLTETKLKYAVVCDRHFISGHPASDFDTENPDWVPSVNMGYKNKPQMQTHKKKCQNSTKPLQISEQEPQKDSKSPHIEYLRTSIVGQNESNETPDSKLSSLDADTSGKVLDEGANISQITESDRTGYEHISPEKNIVEQKMSSSEQYISKGEISLPEEFIVYSKMIASNETYACEGVVSSEENTTDEHTLSGLVNNELHQNMPSKKIQTLLTMNDIDKVYDRYKATIAEVQKLKAKLKCVTGDILHLNEIYC